MDLLTDVDLLEAASRHLTGTGLAESRGNIGKMAAHLGTKHSYLSRILHRTPGAKLSVTHRARLAELLGHQWYEYALRALEEQCDKAIDREFWRGKVRALRQGVLAVALTITALLGANLERENGALQRA